MRESVTTYTMNLYAPHEVTEVKSDQSLLAALLKSNRLIGHSCGGLGTCGSCLVHATGPLTPPSLREQRTLASRSAMSDERLACLAHAVGNITVWAPSWGEPECMPDSKCNSDDKPSSET